MKKVKLIKVRKEIEYIENPQEGKIYWADPRIFKISPCNTRGADDVLDPLRWSKNLERSILHNNFIFPAISDMNFEIVVVLVTFNLSRGN